MFVSSRKRILEVNTMKSRILVLVTLLLLVPLEGWADGRHAIDWTGANLSLSAAQVQDIASKIQNTGVKWVRVNVVWYGSEANPPTAGPQGPHSYFGPRVQAWHNYNFATLGSSGKRAQDSADQHGDAAIQAPNLGGWAILR